MAGSDEEVSEGGVVIRVNLERFDGPCRLIDKGALFLLVRSC